MLVVVLGLPQQPLTAVMSTRGDPVIMGNLGMAIIKIELFLYRLLVCVAMLNMLELRMLHVVHVMLWPCQAQVVYILGDGTTMGNWGWDIATMLMNLL
jgi:hypothetical protein